MRKIFFFCSTPITYVARTWICRSQQAVIIIANLFLSSVWLNLLGFEPTFSRTIRHQPRLFSTSERWDALKLLCKKIITRNSCSLSELCTIMHREISPCTVYIVSFSITFFFFLLFVPCCNEKFSMPGQLNDHLIFIIKANIPSIHSPPLIQVRAAGAATWAKKPRLPSLQPLHPALSGGSRGVLRPTERHMDGRASHLISKPTHPAEEANFCRLYPRSHYVGHYPKFLTIGKARNEDRRLNRELHL